MLTIRKLVPECPSLRFSLEKPLPRQNVSDDMLVVQGWVCTDAAVTQLVVSSNEKQSDYPFNQPRPDVAERLKASGPIWPVVGFLTTLALEQPLHRCPLRIGVKINDTVHWLYEIAQPVPPLNGILLGGSNSLTRFGLLHGMQKYFPGLKTLAAGASSSLQNLFELLRHKDEIATLDFVVTESNINDSQIAFQLKDMQLVLENIDWYYRELSLFAVPVVVILFPYSGTGEMGETPQEALRVTLRHLSNAQKYGFYVIDLVTVFAPLSVADKRLIMSDTRHPLQALMYQLGENLAGFLGSHAHSMWRRQTDGTALLQHDVYLFNDHDDEKVSKENSWFSECLLPVSQTIRVPVRYIGKRAIGIATWSDDVSAVLIASSKTRIVKWFNSFVAFNELLAPLLVDKKTVLAPGGKKKPTEKCLNLPGGAKAKSETMVIGLLLRNVDAILEGESNMGAFYLQELIPELGPFIFTMKFYLKKRALLDKVLPS
ncbi:MAG: hypothetical protein JXR76_16395 [Deltaproteobacteria bacterium]|nr:hypothetical protein [Deltaproteobacteria bacterium]